MVCDMVTQSVASNNTFLHLPGELRNPIYHFYFFSTLEEHDLGPSTTYRRAQCLRPALALLSTSQIIRREATLIFWIDYIRRYHWSFGSRDDEDEHLIRFCGEARKYTLDLDVTFQKRNLKAMSLSMHIAWLVLDSALTGLESAEGSQRLQDEWEVKHQIPGGFVWDKELRIGSHENVVTMRYEHHQNGRSWVRFRGRLALIDWNGGAGDLVSLSLSLSLSFSLLSGLMITRFFLF